MSKPDKTIDANMARVSFDSLSVFTKAKEGQPFGEAPIWTTIQVIGVIPSECGFTFFGHTAPFQDTGLIGKRRVFGGAAGGLFR